MGIGCLVLQPPLPLQEFCPLQPLSPDLQPPLPLQEFLPLQECLSPLNPVFTKLAEVVETWVDCAVAPGAVPSVAVAAWARTAVPVSRPETAAVNRRVLRLLVIRLVPSVVQDEAIPQFRPCTGV